MIFLTLLLSCFAVYGHPISLVIAIGLTLPISLPISPMSQTSNFCIPFSNASGSSYKFSRSLKFSFTYLLCRPKRAHNCSHVLVRLLEIAVSAFWHRPCGRADNKNCRNVIFSQYQSIYFLGRGVGHRMAIHLELLDICFSVGYRILEQST